MPRQRTSFVYTVVLYICLIFLDFDSRDYNPLGKLSINSLLLQQQNMLSSVLF